MDFFFKGVGEKATECPFNEQDIQRCPFLRNIDKPTNFSFYSLNFSAPVNGAKGPIFEDGLSFDIAFKLFHGKDGVIPLSRRSHFRNDNSETAPKFNPLAAKAATISLSGLGLGGPFSFDSFSEKRKTQTKKSESSKKREQFSKGDSSKHEALGNEWLKKGNCPIAKSYRSVNGVLPLVASSLRPPPGLKLKCPPAIVAARAALAKTTLVKTLRPKPLPEKILVIGLLGMAANIPLGIFREHTKKISFSWFIAVHAAVPFIAMLRKSVNMPKTAMAFTLAASVLGQVIGSRAERIRLRRSIDERRSLMVQMASVDEVGRCNSIQFDRVSGKSCGAERVMLSSLSERDGQDLSSSASTSVCV